MSTLAAALSLALAGAMGLPSGPVNEPVPARGPRAPAPAPSAAQDAAGRTWHSLAADDGTAIEYVILTPDDFDPAVPHPVLLALPPGGGGRSMVDWVIDNYYGEQAAARGWVIVSPTAPGAPSASADGSPFPVGETWLPPLLAAVEATLAVEGGVYHLAGVSNGGRRAFRVASHHPERFASMSVLPGVAAQDASPALMAAVARLPLAMHVGEEDTRWVEGSQRTHESLIAAGAARASLDVHAGEGHVLDPAHIPPLFDRLDALREEATRDELARAEVGAVLDDLHEAAAVADEDRYFAHYLPDAIFIGTDASERWTIDQLRAYGREAFQGESAWTYEPLERHVVLSADGRTAWFDERLLNAKYGETRGSGVAQERGGRWRIAQYVLSFAVPNEVAPEVVQVIAENDR